MKLFFRVQQRNLGSSSTILRAITPPGKKEKSDLFDGLVNLVKKIVEPSTSTKGPATSHSAKNNMGASKANQRGDESLGQSKVQSPPETGGGTPVTASAIPPGSSSTLPLSGSVVLPSITTQPQSQPAQGQPQPTQDTQYVERARNDSKLTRLADNLSKPGAKSYDAYEDL